MLDWIVQMTDGAVGGVKAVGVTKAVTAIESVIIIQSRHRHQNCHRHPKPSSLSRLKAIRFLMMIDLKTCVSAKSQFNGCRRWRRKRSRY